MENLDDNFEKMVEKEINSEEQKKENNKKWMYISTGLAFLSILFILIIVLIATLGNFKSGDDDDEAEEEEKLVEWKPAGNRIKTIWGEKLDSSNVWPEYPRPQMERKEWINLNGFWDYFIIAKDGMKPDNPDGQILVPFPIESSLSGVMKSLNQNQELWYEKVIHINENWKNKPLLLHFGAVDWKCEVYINYIKVGEHIGGYSPFYFDIIDFIDFNKKKFTITVKVIDPTNTGYQPVGKQTLSPGGIWYTAVSGIWQTVWLESIPNKTYIKFLNFTSDFDTMSFKLTALLNTETSKTTLSVIVKCTEEGVEKELYNQKNLPPNENITISIKKNHFHPWSPDFPNLYFLEIQLFEDDKEIDFVKTYTAIRKVEKKRDSKTNKLRIFLNNKVLFNMGTLDQGWFPDGLYTPPSEEAMIFDIQKLKDLGFNTIRKHVKVENARYYYYCDKIGMLVWQDMPSGDIGGNEWNSRVIGGGTDKARSKESQGDYAKEWKAIIYNFKFFQSIIIWTPFNEAWGQFGTEKNANLTRDHDPTRLINSASGGNHRLCGDILDLHNYPAPDYYLKEDSEINVLGEYGGLGLEIKGHTWKDDNWGYVVYLSKDEITYTYCQYAKSLENLAQEGFSAAIYTQTTDCESEINGLITYDRKEIKVYEDQIREANVHLINSLSE